MRTRRGAPGSATGASQPAPRQPSSTALTKANTLYYGDNLDVLREQIASESVDLTYLGPPFNSQATYNILFRSPAGPGSEAQIEAFADTCR